LVGLPAFTPGTEPAAEAATRDWPAGLAYGAPWKFPGLLRPAYARPAF